MKQTRPLALLTFTVCLLSACSTASRRAPIVDRAPPPVASGPAAPDIVEEPKEEARGNYVVKRGDTLLRIALDHGLNYRDVVAWNRLANPDDIKVDQVLRLTAPDHVAGGMPDQPGADAGSAARAAEEDRSGRAQEDRTATARWPTRRRTTTASRRAEGREGRRRQSGAGSVARVRHAWCAPTTTRS